ERRQVTGLLPHFDDVVLRDPVRRDVDLLAVDEEVAVPDQLPGHVPGLGEPRPVDHVVQPRLQDLQQDVTGLARPAVGLLVVAPELLLQHSVDPTGLLLLPQLEQVLGLLGPATAMLAGREGTRLERALRALALAALQEQLRLLPTAATAVRTCVTRHFSLYLSDPAPLRRTAAVVRLWRDIGDRAHLQTGGLQRADRGLTTGARALDKDVDLLHPVLHRPARGRLGGQLRGERSGLAGALEAHLARGSPGDHRTVGVGDRHDGVV